MFPNIMKTFLGFFLILAVLRNSVSLICKYCQAKGTTCTEYDLKCKNSNDVCAAILIENTEKGKPERTLLKKCEDPRMCSMPFQYVNMGKGRYERTSILCCKEDRCRNPVPRFEPGFIRPNGKQCPTCLARNSSLCGSDMVDCSGSEHSCIQIKQTFSEGTTWVTIFKKGCATRNICFKQGGSYIESFNMPNPKPICNRARPKN